MGKGNIIINHTLKEYREKYGRDENLLHYTKEEVKAFDKSEVPAHLKKELTSEYNEFLLSGHSWWLINDTYYQIPDEKKFSFKNLFKRKK